MSAERWSARARGGRRQQEPGELVVAAGLGNAGNLRTARHLDHQRRDTHQLVTYGNAALDVARQTGSAGYVGRKLAVLRPQLAPFRADSHVRHLEQELARLTVVSA